MSRSYSTDDSNPGRPSAICISDPVRRQNNPALEASLNRCFASACPITKGKGHGDRSGVDGGGGGW